MRKPSRRPARPLEAGRVRDALLRRVRERAEVAGTLRLPAVPSLLDEYVTMCARLFLASGRGFAGDEEHALRKTLSERTHEAFTGSGRSKLAVNYQATPAAPLGYEITAQVSSIADAYTRWVGTSEAPLFGAHADARVLAAARVLGDPRSAPVLDLGAGTGRNALPLARLGHPVTAVEITASFAEILADSARAASLPVRVVVKDVFADKTALAPEFKLFIASELVPDFRSTAELRKLFALAADVLVEGGLFVVNLHLGVQGYTPEKSAREFAQQCYSALFTPAEVAQAMAGLPLEILGNDSAREYEHQHLPESAWPPTPWYENWVAGLDVYQLDPETSPVELRWLVLRRTAGSEGSSDTARQSVLLGQGRRLRRLEPQRLRDALLQRFRSRCVASGVLTLPALPGLVDHYVALALEIFAALGRDVSAEQQGSMRELFQRALDQAFAAAPRSNIVFTYEVPMGPDLTYSLSPDPVPLNEVYEDWLQALPPPLFGAHADARLVALLPRLGRPEDCAALDLGAGLGRNALALARRGHPVDAVDITGAFIAELERAAAVEQLPLTCHHADALTTEPGKTYGLVLAVGLASDFRGEAELRRLFEVASNTLRDGGLFLLSVHVAAPGYAPDAVAREWGQQSAATFFTQDELTRAHAGMPLQLESDDSAYEFERDHLPEHEFPPTPVFAEWARGAHMFALDPEQARVVELRWLVFVKR